MKISNGVNKKISFPIAIIIIIACAVLTGLIVWQYQFTPEISWEEISFPRKPLGLVTLTTDETEYEQGEVIKITVKNGLDKDIIYITTCIIEPYRVQKFLNDKWLDFIEIEPSARCLVKKEPQFTYEKIKAGQSVGFSWDQKGILPDFGWASSGRYRVLFSYKESETSEELKTIYSNEFTIKEKKVAKKDDKYSCKVAEDCTIKIIGCDKECFPCHCTNYGCVNKDWDLGSDCDIPEGVSCPPSPPWVTNCKCINSKCVDCRGEECRSR